LWRWAPSLFWESCQPQRRTLRQCRAVTVTGSRISIQGYEAPTPVTVIGANSCARRAHEHHGFDHPVAGGRPFRDAKQQPSLRRPQPGRRIPSVVNLRNLGIARTLVLFDGQRVVSSNIFGGGVDLSTIPPRW